jgi:hypothetical protein
MTAASHSTVTISKTDELVLADGTVLRSERSVPATTRDSRRSFRD